MCTRVYDELSRGNQSTYEQRLCQYLFVNHFVISPETMMESELLNVGRRSVDPELELHQDLKTLKEENQHLTKSINKTKAGVREFMRNTRKLRGFEIQRSFCHKKFFVQVQIVKKNFKAFQTNMKSCFDYFRMFKYDLCLSIYLSSLCHSIAKGRPLHHHSTSIFFVHICT